MPLQTNSKKEAQLKDLTSLLQCLECKADLTYTPEAYCCNECDAKYKIIDHIPRFVPDSYLALDDGDSNIQEKTKNYFGFEWDYFKDWGFIKDEEVPEDQKEACFGGMVSNRKMAFNSKCRMEEEELAEGKIILDAGCGNGRYTYEAGINSKGFVIGVDIGYGSVSSAYRNTEELDNVIIIQGNLIDLPFKDEVIDASFSNGVLHHTGATREAFNEVGRTIKPDGTFVAHLYHKLNPIWEINDYLIRLITTRMSIQANLKLAKFLARFAHYVSKVKGGFFVSNLFFRLQPTVHHMFDWYSAPTATHHTYQELADWFYEQNFKVLDVVPERARWVHPWACNLKGRKKSSSHTNSSTT